MSYYFAIISPTDTRLFDLTFGSSKAGGDGAAHFRNAATYRRDNQWIIDGTIDVVEQKQWETPKMWLEVVEHDALTNSSMSCFITGTNVRFILLHQPTSSASRSQQTDEGKFMTEVFDLWVKTSMSPFYNIGDEIKSSVFRARVAAAAQKWL